MEKRRISALFIVDDAMLFRYKLSAYPTLSKNSDSP